MKTLQTMLVKNKLLRMLALTCDLYFFNTFSALMEPFYTGTPNSNNRFGMFKSKEGDTD